VGAPCGGLTSFLCYGSRRMKRWRVAGLAAVALALAGCSTIRSVMGVTTSEPSVEIKSAETRWLLIRNPRFGDVPSEPEYAWVEEDKVPTTLKTLIRGQRSIIAPPEIVAQYGAPPGGGKISARQGMPYQVNSASDATPKAAAAATAPRPAPVPAAAVAKAAPSSPAAPTPAAATSTAPASAAPAPTRGIVVYVDTTRIVIDLTATDGVRAGSVVSLRRDRIPIVHPVTGEVLGELDEEIGTARVIETRDRFSVAEIQSVAPGGTIQVKDRVVPK
jgi:hypothetical protein